VAWVEYFVVRACAGDGSGEGGEKEEVLDAASVAYPSDLTAPRDMERQIS